MMMQSASSVVLDDSEPALLEPRDRPFNGEVYLVKTGWPLGALRLELAHSAGITTCAPGIRGGIRIPFGDRLFPIAPFWPGFLLNTLFYAALIAAPRPAFFWLRSRRRLRRGLCSRCAYDLRGLASPACPECGHPRPGATTLPA
jgi:hypothetical protein